MLDDTTDPNRIYLFGISEGAYGSQRLASFYADYLAAVGPMAGGEPLENCPPENIGNIGFSLLTGEKDFMFGRNLLTKHVSNVLDSLQNKYPGEYAHRVQLIPNMGHGIDYRPTTPWLQQFRRNPWPSHFIWEDYEMASTETDSIICGWTNALQTASVRAMMCPSQTIVLISRPET